MTDADPTLRIVITGANRGIGLEFVVQSLDRGWLVEAGARDVLGATQLAALQRKSESRLRIHALDVASPASISSFATAIGDVGVDLLINNAGVGGKHKSLDTLDAEDLVDTLRVNAIGPVLVTRVLLPTLRKGHGKKVVHISSGLGSIGDNTSGGTYGYRMSKAALNMASRNLAHDLRADGIISIVMNPGWVQTDMGGKHAPLQADESVRAMLGRIDALTLADSGTFLNYRGGTYEW